MYLERVSVVQAEIGIRTDSDNVLIVAGQGRSLELKLTLEEENRKTSTSDQTILWLFILSPTVGFDWNIGDGSIR